MKILSALRKKKVVRDFYLSLILKPHKVAAILFEKTASSLVIISTKEAALEKNLDALTGEELVQVIDTVTSSVEGAMPEGQMVEKTIFSVPYSWQIEGKITRDNLLKLKQICDALELKAIGFIISSEAIVNFMQKKDGVPVKAIFVEHAANQAFVYIVQNSAIVEVQSSEVGEDFVATVEKLLTQVEKVESLPSKIVLHDYEGAESLQQEFLNHEWKKELNFLHVPQVLVLEKGFENEAVINGVATQMGFDVLHDVKAGGVVDADENIDEDLQDMEIASAEEFGFGSADALPPAAIKTGAEEAELDEDANSEDLHATMPADEEDRHGGHDNLVEPKINALHETDEDLEDITPHEGEHKSHAHKVHSDTRVIVVDTLKKLAPIVFMRSLFSGKGAKSLLKKGMNLRVGVMAFGVVALLAMLTYGYYAFFLKAEVIIFSDSQVVSSDEEVTFSPDESTSFDDKIIALGTLTESVDVSNEREVTGTKETGEKATGEVTVYNKTERPVTFEKGTIIASSNDVEFVTLGEVKIASTSSFSTSFTSQKIKIEASEFGKEYNLPSNTNFTVDGEGTADYFAKNDSAFSGGSKKELTVVSEKDLEALRSEAEKGTLEKAVLAASKKIGNDVLLIKSPLSSKLEEEKFSKKEGEEAKSVSLTGKLVYTFGTYTKEDLAEFVQQMAQSEIPDGYSYIDDQSDIQVNDVIVDEDDVTGKLTVNAVFGPTIETSKILGELEGKRLKNAEQLVGGLKGVSDYTIIRRNAFPIFPSFLPFNSKNIQVTVKTDG